MTINVNDRTYQEKNCSDMFDHDTIKRGHPIVTIYDVFTVILMKEKQGFQR